MDRTLADCSDPSCNLPKNKRTLMKRTYEAPELDPIEIAAEQGFASSMPWYDEAGTGDFNYGIDDDETWG